MIDGGHPTLPVSRQCSLDGISRSAFYGPRKRETPLNLALKKLIDAQFLEIPWYGSRQMARHLRRQGHVVGRKRVQAPPGGARRAGTVRSETAMRTVAESLSGSSRCA